MYRYQVVDSNGDTLEFLRSRDTGCRGSEALFRQSASVYGLPSLSSLSVR